MTLDRTPFLLIFLCLSCLSLAQNRFMLDSSSTEVWVDSVLNEMTVEEKIAQLIVIRAHSDKDADYVRKLSDDVRKFQVGGVCFFQGGPVRQALITNQLAALVKVPLMVSIDGEWGLGMRLDSTHSFPKQITLGAIRDGHLIYRMGREVGEQCRRLGIHVNYAPVVDVNSNPGNPIICSRSFGQDPVNVGLKGIAYMKGMQDNGVMACAKHFPGHGDTDTDSHLTLPVLNHSKQEMASIHLKPFEMLIDSGLQSVMVAHLFIPAYDPSKNKATSLSRTVVTHMLKTDLSFNGLIITDALGMSGVSGYNKQGVIEVKAFQAGNDVLLLPQNVQATIDQFKIALDSGDISMEMLDNRVRRMLRAKCALGLTSPQHVDINNLYSDLHPYRIKQLEHDLARNYITVIKNSDSLIPIQPSEMSIATLSIGPNRKTDFQYEIDRYTQVKHHWIDRDAGYGEIKAMSERLSAFDLVIVSVQKTNYLPKYNFGITQKSVDLINMLTKQSKVLLNLFANPYALARIENNDNLAAVVVSYEDRDVAEEASAQVIFGDLSATGVLPVSASADFPVGTSIRTSQIARLREVGPDDLKLSAASLSKADSIAVAGVKLGAYPGCQILAAKDGQVFYHKSFGYHTYDSITPVTNDDIYDLASVTKILATTLSVMKLYDEGKIDINKTLGDYLPGKLDGSNKSDIRIKDVMAHQGRLVGWIPFYIKTITEKSDMQIYNAVRSEQFCYRVAEDLYINKAYKDVLLNRIVDTKLYNKNEYRYSDLGFYLLKEIVEAVSGQKLSEYVAQHFYQPMGLKRIGFCPREWAPLEKMIPTERDTVFRKQIIHGDVHDPGAAMLGGVSGHAGLFADAHDVAVLMQMLLQRGEYVGVRYIQPETIDLFTRYQFPKNNNRRGLGFDKPQVNGGGVSACKLASARSFGHSGFTGTYAWADPENNLVYVFLSNRIYPDPENKKITEYNIRTEIQKAFYEAVGE